jgi:hypothetical protein
MPLDVIAVISNPVRYHSRERLYKQFEPEMLAAGVRLTTVEAAFGERPFAVTSAKNRRHVQVRIQDELWQKENLINLGISHLPEDWKYVAWIDADVTFTRPNWARETIEQLQHYQVVQMFSHAVDMGPNHETLQTHTGFGYSYVSRRPPNHGGAPYEFWHPGFAWAARRSFIEKVEGLMDWTLLGAADHIMACALIDHQLPLPAAIHKLCPNYVRLSREWQVRASHFAGDLGYVPGTLLHHFHGAKANRKYVERWSIISGNRYDPCADIRRDWQGVVRFTGNKPGMRDDLRMYFRQRDEDNTSV